MRAAPALRDLRGRAGAELSDKPQVLIGEFIDKPIFAEAGSKSGIEPAGNFLGGQI